MTEKYSFDTRKIKNNIRDLRKGKKLTQAQLSENINRDRSALSNWESDKIETIPPLDALLSLANYFQVDLDYILGASNIESEDTKEIANVTHLSMESVAKLRQNAEYGSFIDRLLTEDDLPVIAQRIQQLSYHQLLEDIIYTSFEKQFAEKIQKAFDAFYFCIFPMDMSPESFKNYLKEIYPYKETFNAVEFLENNFLEDGQAFVYNRVEGFFSMDSFAQYCGILSAIVEISYDYYISNRVVELSKQKLAHTLLEILENSIQREAKEIKARIKTKSNT